MLFINQATHDIELTYLLKFFVAILQKWICRREPSKLWTTLFVGFVCQPAEPFDKVCTWKEYQGITLPPSTVKQIWHQHAGIADTGVPV